MLKSTAVLYYFPLTFCAASTTYFNERKTNDYIKYSAAVN